MSYPVPQIGRPLVGQRLLRGHPLAPDLGAWLLNEGAGSAIGNLAYPDQMTSTGTAAPVWTGEGLSFPTNAWFSPAFADPRYRPTSFTIAARIKVAGTGNQDILRADPGLAPNRNYFLRLVSGAVNGFTFLSGTNSQATGSTTLSAGQWYDVAYTFSGVASKVYVNGKLDGTGTGSGSFANAPTAMCLGNFPQGFEPFSGTIAHVYFYSRVLSADELRQIAWQPYQVIESPASFYFSSTTDVTATVSVLVGAGTIPGVGLSLGATDAASSLGGTGACPDPDCLTDSQTTAIACQGSGTLADPTITTAVPLVIAVDARAAILIASADSPFSVDPRSAVLVS